MGDGEPFETVLTQHVKPPPQIGRVARVSHGEGTSWRVTAEDHVAVQVPAIVGAEGVLVPNECCERAWVVVSLGGRDNIAPRAARGPFGIQGIHRLQAPSGPVEWKERIVPANGLIRPQIPKLFSQRFFVHGALRVVHRP